MNFVYLRLLLLCCSCAFLSAATAPVARTGQVLSHGTGDDGSLALGVVYPAIRFTDNNDGTVTDHATGLIWMRDPGSLASERWAEAIAVCATISDGTNGLSDGSQAGDWRMANINELRSLADYGRNSPALPEGHPFVPPSSVWSSTTIPTRRGRNALIYVVSSGLTTGIGKTLLTKRFWPVRTGPNPGPVKVAATGAGAVPEYTLVAGEDGDLQAGTPWPSTRFTDNDDGTVTDHLTGLIWLRDASAAGAGSWEDALATCNELASGNGNLDDGSTAGSWRLPNLRELQSLLASHQASFPSLPTGHPFTNVALDRYWSSTTDAGSYDQDAEIWRSAFCILPLSGTEETPLKTANFRIWPVRDAVGGIPQRIVRMDPISVDSTWLSIETIPTQELPDQTVQFGPVPNSETISLMAITEAIANDG